MDLHQLCSQPESLRDANWEKKLFSVALDSKVVVDQQTPQEGPDGWPYLFVRTGGEAAEPLGRIIEWLSSRGIGLAVNAHKMSPDYLFTFGMLWNFREKGQFITAAPLAKSGVVEFAQGEKVLAGPPTNEYLPPYVRQILKHFLKDQGIDDPKILLLSRDRVQYDLCFSLEALGNPQESEHRGIAEAISWFLPAHYSIMLAKEEGLPPFYSLSEATAEI